MHGARIVCTRASLLRGWPREKEMRSEGTRAPIFQKSVLGSGIIIFVIIIFIARLPVRRHRRFLEMMLIYKLLDFCREDKVNFLSHGPRLLRELGAIFVRHCHADAGERFFEYLPI